MIGFFDSSSLFKKYIEEQGSFILRDLFGEFTVYYTSILTKLEIATALEVSKKVGRINSPIYHLAFRDLESDFKNLFFQSVTASDALLAEAFRLVRQRKLRAPDAIQLASALELKKQSKMNITFVCSDQKLLDAARLESMKVFNPI